MSTSLADLKIAVRARADLTNSQFNEDGIVSFINAAYRALYDLIVSTQEDYRLDHFEFTMNGEDGYDIPDSVNIYKLKGLDYLYNTPQPQTVHRFQWQERNNWSNLIAYNLSGPWTIAPFKYDYVGSRIVFRPVGAVNGPFRAWFLPDIDPLVENEDTIFKDLDKWQNFIVVDAAIKLLDSEESDTSSLQRELAMLINSIRSFAGNRDAGSPKRIANTKADYFFGTNFPRYR